MMIDCPDCGAKIPDTEKKCPVCGSILDVYSLAAAPDLPAVPAPLPPPPEKPRVSLLKIIFRRLFELVVFLLILSGVIFAVLLTDFKGARTELRNMCMTDSGSGSKGDEQILRVEVKHWILMVLNLIDNGGTDERVIKIPDPDEKPAKREPSAVRKRVERAPLELPPDPPEVEPFRDSSREYVPETAGASSGK